MPDLKTGDRVKHIGRNEIGTVTIMPNGDVQVLFDKRTPRGNMSVGIYDEQWFLSHPNWLQPDHERPSRLYRSDFKPT